MNINSDIKFSSSDGEVFTLKETISQKKTAVMVNGVSYSVLGNGDKKQRAINFLDLDLSSPAQSMTMEELKERIKIKGGSDILFKRQAQVQENLVPRLYPPRVVMKPASIEQRMKEYHIPGVSVTVINHFKEEWSEGFGELESPEVRIQAASVSKSITALTVLSLIQDEKFKDKFKKGLDTDVKELLQPELWDKINPEHKPVTISALLSHTAGIVLGEGQSGFTGYPQPEEIPEEIKFKKDRLETLKKESKDENRGEIEFLKRELASLSLLQKRLPTVEEILEGQNPQNLRVNSGEIRVAGPQGKFHYQGGGPMIIQKLIEEVTGQQFSQVVDERVFKKLGMDHSCYTIGDLPHAQGYDSHGRAIPGGSRIYPELAAAGLWSTPQDLAKVVIEIQKAYQGEGAILDKETAEKMLVSKKGLGLAVPLTASDKSSVYFYHTGDNNGFCCLMIGNLEGQGAVIMTNSDNGSVLREEIALSAAKVYGWEDYQQVDVIQPLVDPKKIGELDVPAWTESHSGAYQTSQDLVFKVFKGKTENIMGQFIVNNEEETPFEIFPVSEEIGCFRYSENEPYKQINFVKDQEGKVATVQVFGDKFKRIYGNVDSI